MRIGLYGGAATPDKIVEQAQQAEADGFSSLWYASGVLGDPLVAMALAGRATSTIELGTAVLQTYPCHPLLQAQRAASVAAAMGRPGFTLGVGPSHESNVSGIYGMSYEHPGRNTEEYVRVLTALLRGEDVEFEGEDWTVRTQEGAVATPHPIPVLLSALSPRLLRVAGEYADGAVLWMATAAAIEEHVTPRITAAATAAGRPAPRIVAGLPLAVHSKFSHMRFEPSGLTNDEDIRVAKSLVDYIFRWMGKKFLSADQQEEAGILSPEVKARLAQAYSALEGREAVPADAPLAGQTALFNAWEDAVECARCGGRMVRTGSCYTCRDCGTNTGCS